MQPSSPTPHPFDSALVLAGGGVAGIAWELGVLCGIADVDPGLATRVLAADLIVGTSAGSSVAAQITSGVPLEDLYALQLRPDSAEIEVDVDIDTLLVAWGAAMSGATDREDAGRRVGTLALDARTADAAVRRAAVDARLPVKSWPRARRLLLTAVDAGSGELATFSDTSGVELVDAVTASCAVPGVWPPVTIAGRHYIDGGVRSMTNADLAAGATRVLVVQPGVGTTPPPWGGLDAELAALAPAAAHVIGADEASAAAFGSNPLSPATRPASAAAGRRVGAEHAAAVAALWSTTG